MVAATVKSSVQPTYLYVLVLMLKILETKIAGNTKDAKKDASCFNFITS